MSERFPQFELNALNIVQIVYIPIDNNTLIKSVSVLIMSVSLFNVGHQDSSGTYTMYTFPTGVCSNQNPLCLKPTVLSRGCLKHLVQQYTLIIIKDVDYRYR